MTTKGDARTGRQRNGDSRPRAHHSLALFASLRGYQRAWLSRDLLAGVTVWAVLVPEALAYAALVELVDFSAIAELRRAYTANLGRIYGFAARPDFIAAVITLLGVLVFDTLPGLLIGVGVSLLLLLYRASRPNVAELGEVAGAPGTWADVDRSRAAKAVEGITILRVESGLFFANADHVRARILAAANEPGTHAIVVDAASMPFIDLTASRMLARVARELDRRNITLAVAHEVGQVRDVLRHAPGGDGVPSLYPSIREAVDALRSRENGTEKE